MEIVQEITFREMTRRWAIGEVMSEFFHKKDVAYRQDTLRLLRSENQTEVTEGIMRHQIRIEQLTSSVHKETRWYTSKISVTKEEFAELYTNTGDGWKRYSSGTFKLSDAAVFLRQNPSADMRITGIISELVLGNFEPTGITLLGRALTGPYHILEGNGRMTAVYVQCLLQEKNQNCPSNLEIVFGHVQGS